MAAVRCGLVAPTQVATPLRRECGLSSARGALRALCYLPESAALRTEQGARRAVLVTRMGIRAVESFDAAFQLTPESDQLLRSMLTSEAFLKQVGQNCALGEGVIPEFTGEIFQPVPWSQTTKHGMLPEYEEYYHDKENYVIVNVPPQIMFKAKIFKPSRLCAIFKKVSPSS